MTTVCAGTIISRSRLRCALPVLAVALACFAASLPPKVFGDDGTQNTATGSGALSSNTTGSDSVANGFQALFSNTTGGTNTAIGSQALADNTIGGSNTATGHLALSNNTSGVSNTANGNGALVSNTTGVSNTAVGNIALANSTTGSSNIALGASAGSSVTTASSVIAIGAAGANVSNKCYIGQIFGQTASGGTTVFINSSGQLGTSTSSARFKQDIRSMDKASESILGLRPVTFRYKKEVDPQELPQFGLVAEEVERINPSLVVRDADGKPYSVRYEAVNAMLLNEFLKEREKVEQQQATIAGFQSKLAQQEKQIEALTSGLQKVNAELALSKPRPQMAGNNR
jgi:hypothetical protein